MPLFFLDTETYQGDPAKDLPKVGHWKYSTGAEITLAGYFWNGTATVWDLRQDATPDETFVTAVQNPELVKVAHNAPFDYVMVKNALQLDTAIQHWHCTSVQALAHGLPGSLAQLGEALGLDEDKAKMKDGKRLVLNFCKPAGDHRKADRYDHTNRPDDWERFVEYCRQDVVALREIYDRLPTWNYPDNRDEVELWHLDQKINETGLPIDLETVNKVIDVVDREAERLHAIMREVTGGAVESGTAVKQLKDWMAAQGVETDSLAKPAVNALLAGELPESVRLALETRQQAGKTSTAKYIKLKEATDADGRLRGTLQFCGASRTGRWGGRLFQPQNLPRGKVNGTVAAEAFAAGIAHLCYADLMEAASSAVRGMICAPPGKRLAVADLANIEGRVLAWVVEDEEKLERFRAYDAGTGADLYNVAYTDTFGGDPWNCTKAQRTVGKPIELGLGYEGGVGAFNTMAAVYGVNLDDIYTEIWPTATEEEQERAEWMLQLMRGKKVLSEMTDEQILGADVVKQRWRAKNPKAVQFWRDMRDATTDAVLSGISTKVGRVVVSKTHHSGAGYLLIRLPSGRFLSYPHPEIVYTRYQVRGVVEVDGEAHPFRNEYPVYSCREARKRTEADIAERFGAEVDCTVCEFFCEAVKTSACVTYMGLNQQTRQWERLTSYGGKFTENICQAVARDVLAHGMKLADAAGYKIVTTVHDEIVTEISEGELNHTYLEQLMSDNPPWAEGLPLAAEGYTAKRYKK